MAKDSGFEDWTCRICRSPTAAEVAADDAGGGDLRFVGKFFEQCWGVFFLRGDEHVGRDRNEGELSVDSMCDDNRNEKDRAVQQPATDP